MHKFSTATLAIALIVLAVIAGLLFVLSSSLRGVSASSFDECVRAGYPVAETFPQQCRTPDGRVFVNPAQVEFATSTEPVTTPTSTPETTPIVAGGCATAGCSNELCVEESEAANIVTTCVYRAEYACYRSARCERQQTGRCGWTQTAALRACLANPPVSGESPEPIF